MDFDGKIAAWRHPGWRCSASARSVMFSPLGGETRLPDACEQSRPHLAPGTLYADLSTGAPGDKRRLAELLEPAGAAFVDGAIMVPIPLRGLATPILASGPEAGRFSRACWSRSACRTP
ncbi:hypothetical protein [Nonomuraea sp. GTA35]|uniref:hypothetical protein n=1 Tax=Nonomuraea sp. GTA35 TaxID=1676746 RepID=UPI0035C0B29E